MKKIILNIPDKLDISENETKRFLAAKLYESGKLSLGQAADLANMTKLTFSELLSDYNVSFINYPTSDLLRDASQF